MSRYFKGIRVDLYIFFFSSRRRHTRLQGDWSSDVCSSDLTTGDKLWTDQGSRAELDIGAAAIRLGATTGFSFLNLDDHTAQMQVTAGTLIEIGRASCRERV